MLVDADLLHRRGTAVESSRLPEPALPLVQARGAPDLADDPPAIPKREEGGGGDLGGEEELVEGRLRDQAQVPAGWRCVRVPVLAPPPRQVHAYQEWRCARAERQRDSLTDPPADPTGHATPSRPQTLRVLSTSSVPGGDRVASPYWTGFVFCATARSRRSPPQGELCPGRDRRGDSEAGIHLHPPRRPIRSTSVSSCCTQKRQRFAG